MHILVYWGYSLIIVFGTVANFGAVPTATVGPFHAVLTVVRFKRIKPNTVFRFVYSS